jgi:transketolase
MRNVFAETLFEEAVGNPKIFVVAADISPSGSMAKFGLEYPDRVINVGVAEQSMIGICAGLAIKGCQPFAYTIATFSLYRPFEMVRDDLCYQNLPVTVVGMGAGAIYSTLGGTHQAIEDIAIASALPNMQIIAPCDPLECAEAVRWCARQRSGPVYLRLGKSGESTLTKDAASWQFGKIRKIRAGSDICILTYGVIAAMAVNVADSLTGLGYSVAVVSVHTMKPLDRRGIASILTNYQHVVVIEEHVPQGGLAAQTKQIAWECKARCRLNTFTLQDEFIHNYGTRDEFLAAHGLSVEWISAAVALDARAFSA